MSINFQQIETKLMSIVSESIGEYLSDLGSSGLKSVIPARALYSVKGKLPTTPPYPYATVNLTNIEENRGWRREEYLDEDDNLVSTSDKDLYYTIRVFGSTILDEGTGEIKVATELANDAQSYLRLPSVIADIGNTIDGQLISVDSVTPVPQFSGGDYIESAVFKLVITATDRITSAASGVFDTVITEGEVKLTEEDPTPTPFTIISPDV